MMTLILRRYLLFTIIVLGLSLGMVGLGFWQLARHQEKSAANVVYLAQIAGGPLAITTAGLPGDPTEIEYFNVVVTGQFDHANEIVIRNRRWRNQAGVHLLTPLVLAGGQTAILVDRGWIPEPDLTDRSGWAQYAQPGEVLVTGMVIRDQPLPNAPPQTAPELSMFRMDIARVQRQVDYRLLPMIVVQAPAENDAQIAPPFRALPDPDLDAGPHLGYAIQWFSFAIVGLVGFYAFMQRQLRQPK